jgi:hypothetical protein
MNIKELVIGAVIGAAVAVAATRQLDAAQATPAAVTSAPVAPAATAPLATVAPPSPVPAAVASSSGATGAVSAQAAVKPASAIVCPPTVAAAEPRKAITPAAPAVDVPAVSLSAEHAKMLLSQDQQPPSLPELHARFAGEPLDSAWSQQMEAQLRQGLQDAGVQKGFDVLAVECRRTMCELRLFGTGDDAAHRWGAITAQVSQQPWWNQNVAGMTMSTTEFNGRAVIATILQRKKP